MRKFISMLTTLALASTIFTVSAFAEQKPTLNFEVTPYTDYDELTGHNEYVEEAEEIPEGYTAYVIDYYLTNLELSNSGSQNSPTGTVLTEFLLYLKTSSEELDLIDSIVTYANYSIEPEGKGYEWDSYYYTARLLRSKGAFPKKTQDGGDVFASTVVMIPTDKSVELTFMNDVFNNGNVTFTNLVNTATYTSGTLNEGSEKSYKLSEEALALASDKIVLGTPAPQGPTVTKGETISANNVTEYTFTNSEEFKDTKVLLTEAATNGSAITENTRFKVTYNNEAPRYFGSDIWSKMAQGGGSISVQSTIKFGLIVDADKDASLFKFEIIGLQ